MKFTVTVKEVYSVVYEMEAKNIDEIKKLIEDGEFGDNGDATYLETLENETIKIRDEKGKTYFIDL